MATQTYDLISSTTLSSAVQTVTLNSIPSSYRDLVLVMTAAATGTSYYGIYLNNNSSSVYDVVSVESNGSAQAANAYTSTRIYPSYSYNGVNTTPHLSIWQFLDYSRTDKHKIVLQRGNTGSLHLNMLAAKYASTSAISRIDIECGSQNWAAGSTFYLYGIEA